MRVTGGGATDPLITQHINAPTSPGNPFITLTTNQGTLQVGNNFDMLFLGAAVGFDLHYFIFNSDTSAGSSANVGLGMGVQAANASVDFALYGTNGDGGAGGPAGSYAILGNANVPIVIGPSGGSGILVNIDGTVSFREPIGCNESTTAPVITSGGGAGGTIATAGVGTSRVSTGGAVTGAILQAGTFAGQKCTVINESGNSITFDVVGTSHVADGNSAVIAGNRAMDFTWNTHQSKWYHS